jgi:hypothetical protein
MLQQYNLTSRLNPSDISLTTVSKPIRRDTGRLYSCTYKHDAQ